MKKAAALLEELRALDESVTIEAKAASQIGRAVFETVCAYSNEPGLGGGYLLLGVSTSHQLGLFSRQYEVTGTNDDPGVIDLGVFTTTPTILPTGGSRSTSTRSAPCSATTIG